MNRSITQQATRIVRRSRAPRTPSSGRCAQASIGSRFASTSSSSSGSSGSGHETGPNSMLVGAGLMSATLLAGYAMGKASERQGKGDLQAEAAAPVKKEKKSKKPKEAAKTTSKAAPAAVVRKADEADESMPSKSDTSSSSPASSKDSSRSSSPAPSSAGGESIDSSAASLSDPGAISETEALAGPGEGEEDPGQAAFNPETGEINWDCPCLGGMAHGVCGEEFKAAFSCFVYSQEEPKGQDCIEKFRGMQDCFRAHPDVYGEEVVGEEGEFDGQSDDSDYDIVSAVEEALKEVSSGNPL